MTSECKKETCTCNDELLEEIEVKITDSLLLNTIYELNNTYKALTLENNSLILLKQKINIKRQELYLRTDFKELKLSNEKQRNSYVENELKSLLDEQVQLEININNLKSVYDEIKAILNVYKMIYNRETEFKGLKI